MVECNAKAGESSAPQFVLMRTTYRHPPLHSVFSTTEGLKELAAALADIENAPGRSVFRSFMRHEEPHPHCGVFFTVVSGEKLRSLQAPNPAAVFGRKLFWRVFIGLALYGLFTLLLDLSAQLLRFAR